MSKVAVPRLVGPRVVLRGVRPHDIEGYIACGRDPEIVRMLGADADSARPLTSEDGARWYRSMQHSSSPYEWVIEVAGSYVGTCRLYSLIEWDRRASFAIAIMAPGLLGQGLGREATRLVLAHAFGPAGLHRVDLRVLAYNTRAIACYRACGFTEEGREREAAKVDGTWHDFMIMSILESDPAALALLELV